MLELQYMPEPSPERKPDLPRIIQKEFGVILILEGRVDPGSDMYNNTLTNLQVALRDLKKFDAKMGNEFIRRTTIFITDKDEDHPTPEGPSGFYVRWNDSKSTILQRLQASRKRRGEIYAEDRKTLPLDEEDEDDQPTEHFDD